jgi:hypothetical protein
VLQKYISSFSAYQSLEFRVGQTVAAIPGRNEGAVVLPFPAMHQERTITLAQKYPHFVSFNSIICVYFYFIEFIGETESDTQGY